MNSYLCLLLFFVTFALEHFFLFRKMVTERDFETSAESLNHSADYYKSNYIEDSSNSFKLNRLQNSHGRVDFKSASMSKLPTADDLFGKPLPLPKEPPRYQQKKMVIWNKRLAWSIFMHIIFCDILDVS